MLRTPYLAPDDFNGLSRRGSSDIGAYRWHSDGNPGWILAGEIKKLFLIFLDGFESGKLANWSATRP